MAKVLTHQNAADLPFCFENAGSCKFTLFFSRISFRSRHDNILLDTHLINQAPAPFVNLEPILIKLTRHSVVIVIVALSLSRQIKEQLHAHQNNTPSEDQHCALFVTLVPTPNMQNQQLAWSAHQENMPKVQDPQYAIPIPIARQKSGQNPAQRAVLNTPYALHFSLTLA